MAIVVVGGSAKDVGKTALVCAVIAALPEFRWTAVKLRGHDYEPAPGGLNTPGDPEPVIREEHLAGEATDTARYLAAGARRSLLVTRSGPDVPVQEIRRALGEDHNVIFESNRIVDMITPDVVLALVSGAGSEQKPSFRRLLDVADAVVSVGAEFREAPSGAQQFRLHSLDRLTPVFVQWLRDRLPG